MDDKQIKSILQEALEEQVPASQVDLLPAIQSRLVAGRSSLQQQGETMNVVRIKRLALAALVAIVVLTMALITPPGRAFAQRIFLFFTTTNEKSFPIPTEQVFSVPATGTAAPTYIVPLQPVQPATQTATPQPDPACSSPEAQASYDCQIRAVEAQAGFDAKELPSDPKGMKFLQAHFDPTTKEIGMEFAITTGGAGFYFRQGMGEFPSFSEWNEVPADQIKQVSVNGQYAELVSGMFVIYPNATEAVWQPQGQLRLRWREGNRWFSLEKMGDPYPVEWLDEKEMIKLAESLVDARPSNQTPPADPENLTSVDDAEALAGFDVPEPSLLPDGYELKRVAWRDDIVRLFYGPKASNDYALIISMGSLADFQAGPCSECPPGAVKELQVGPWPGWYMRGSFNMGEGSNVNPTPTPVWEADSPRWGLDWNTDTLWFSISYFSSSDGGEMNEETMLKIAESLK